MSWAAFLLSYLLGGLTFVPLVVASVLLHAYLTLPRRDDAGAAVPSASDSVVQPGDDVSALDAARKEEVRLRAAHQEYDVSAGYFAVCREYTPMGINAKPIERTTPVGSATVAAPSPSVYQAMYRSIFDRKQAPGPLDNHYATSQRPKKAGNVFYVVLRHGHLMLFDDDEQLEVRHVISLAYHEVSIYSGSDQTPEGELFIKKNAICLARRADNREVGPDTQLSKPFYLFSENCSAKEDFYFALLKNQEQTFAADRAGPSPLGFDVEHIISLVQRLHYSEDHMQTRWLNALLGRLFLAVYKTRDVENFVKEKLTKKISRVKRPSFLSNIAIKSIDTGDSAPYITNPRLKDLTVAGECGLEADVRYTGNFRLEVAATARIDLGARFKAREVNLVLAVVVRKVEGHLLLKIKPPPSNRLWFSFQQMPKLEMTIEPIVSSRQITYTVILRQIENRIKEVIAETLVLPFWDDTPFFNTEHKNWRGGIFAGDDAVQSTFDPETTLAQFGDVEDVETQEETAATPDSALPHVEKSHSMPAVETAGPGQGPLGRKTSNKGLSTPVPSSAASATSTDSRSREGQPIHRLSRSGSFARPPTPAVGTDATNSDDFKPSSSPPDQSPATAAAANTTKLQGHLSSQPASPSPSQFRPYMTSKSSNRSSASSRDATDTEKETGRETGRDDEGGSKARRDTASSVGSLDGAGSFQAAGLQTTGAVRNRAGSAARGFFSRRDTSDLNAPPVQGTGEQKRTALAAVTNAAASAKRWGLNAIQRHQETASNGQTADRQPTVDLNQPMGRGQPLPPPGTPLPMPEKKTKTAPMPVPRRKPVPAPPLPNRQAPGARAEHRPVPAPPLPKRRHLPAENDPTACHDMLVVAAPAESEPTTPTSASNPSHAQPWDEDAETINVEDDGPSHEDEAPLAAGPEESSSTAPLMTASTPEAKCLGNDDDEEGEGGGEDGGFSAWVENTGETDAKVTSPGPDGGVARTGDTQ